MIKANIKDGVRIDILSATAKTAPFLQGWRLHACIAVVSQVPSPR